MFSNTNPFGLSEKFQLPECVSLFQENRRKMCMEIAKSKREETIKRLRETLYLNEIHQNSDASQKTDEGEISDKDQAPPDSETFFSNLTINKEVSVESNISAQSSVEQPNSSYYYAKHYTVPDHLLSIPEGFGPDWMVLAKPKGHRCLVTSYAGKTISRDYRGHKTKKFKSLLPGGSTATKDGKTCILDCIYDKSNNIMYIMDILVWEQEICTENAAFDRMAAIDKILEIQGLQQESDDNICAFRTPVKYKCDLEGFSTCYACNSDYLKDGLYFILNIGTYKTGHNPFILWWKDYNVYQAPETPNNQYILKVNGFGQIMTRDNKVIVVLSEEESMNLKTKTFVKVKIHEVKLKPEGDSLESLFEFPKVELIEVVKKRTRSDKLEKIMYDFFGTCITVKYEDIIKVLKSLSN